MENPWVCKGKIISNSKDLLDIFPKVVSNVLMEIDVKQRLLRMTHISEKEWEIFSKHLRLKLMQPGEILDRDCAGFILNGLMRAYYPQENGVDILREFAKEDDLICYMTMYENNETQDLVIEAIEPTTIYLILQKELEFLYDNYPSFAQLGRKIMEEAYFKRVRRERQLLANELAARYKQFQIDYPGFENRLPQKYIASFLGATPVHFSRMKSKLRKNK